MTPQLVDGRIAYQLAENECKLLRSACRQIRASIRAPQPPDFDAMAGSKEAYEVVRFNLVQYTNSYDEQKLIDIPLVELHDIINAAEEMDV